MCPYITCFLFNDNDHLFSHIFIGLRCFLKNSGFMEVIAHRYVLSVKSSLEERLSSGTSWVHLRGELYSFYNLMHIVKVVQCLIFAHINQMWVICKARMINCGWHYIALGPKAVQHSWDEQKIIT